MSGWLNLLKKEYRMTRTSAAVQLAMILIAGLWVSYANQEHLGIVVAPASMLVIFAVFYPAFFMLKSVNKELKQTPHLWLHCPQPAWMLLTAKLVTAVGVMLAILVVDAIFVYVTIFSVSEQTGIPTENLALFVTEVGAYTAIAIIGVSIYLASWGSLIAVASNSARKLLGRYNWLAGLATLFIATWGMGKLQHTWLYQTLTQWGAFKINLLTLEKVLPPDISVHNQSFAGLQLYTGQIVITLLVAVGVFALSSWLIDNKVEV